jgi:hypothetical protein
MEEVLGFLKIRELKVEQTCSLTLKTEESTE